MGRKTIVDDAGIISAIDKLGDTLKQQTAETASEAIQDGVTEGVKDGLAKATKELGKKRVRKMIQSEFEIEENLYTFKEGGVNKLKRGKKHVEPLRNAYKKSLPRIDEEFDAKFIKEFTKVKQLGLLNVLDKSEKQAMESFYQQILEEDEKFQDLRERATKAHVETMERLNQEALQRSQDIATKVRKPDKTEVLSGNGVAESFDKAEEKIESVNEKLQESKKYVNDVRQAFMHVVGRAGDRDALLEQYPELSDFKNRKSVDNARAFLDTDEWNDFLSTLPQAHTYLESIGYDFERIYKLTDEEIAWFKGLDLEELAKRQWSVNGTPDKVDYKGIRAAYQTYQKELSNQTPLSSPTAPNKTADAVEEAAREIKVADEKIESSNEEVEQSEEELEQTTVNSRKKGSDAAKKESNKIVEANKKEIASNEAVTKSRKLKYNIATIDNIPRLAFNPLNTETSSVGINNESSSADKVKQSMDKASESKKKFAKANKKVEESAKASEEALEAEADAAEDVADAVDNDKATKQNEKAAKAYDKLVSKGKEYYTLLSKFSNNPEDLTSEENRRLEELQQEFADATQGAGKFARAMDELGEHLGSQESNNEYDFAKSRYLKDAGKSYIDSLKQDIGEYNKFYNTIAANKRGLQPVVEYQQKINELKVSIKELEALEKQGVDIINSDDLAKTEKLKQTIKELKDELRLMKNNKDFQVADGDEAYRQMAKISQILEKNTKMSRSMKEQFRSLQQDYEIVIKTGDSQKRLEELNVELSKMHATLLASGRTGNSFFNLVGKKINGMAAQFFATYLSFQDLLQLARQGFEIIKEYDAALTEMNKVSKESLSTLKEYQQESFKLADAIGATASALQNSTADWMRLGETLEKAKQSAEATNILFNVSEFNSIDEATDSLISMSQAYKDLEKMDIVDIMNNIGNNYAISTDGLASALQKSASALTTAGNDINEAVALITAGNAVVQDADSVGTGMQTIALRLVGTKEAKEELEALGEDADDVITTTSKLRDIIMSATKAASEDGKGFDILDDNGNYKSTYEIMSGLADMYDEIVKKDKELGTNNLNLLLETVAGKRRANIAASILQNKDLLDSVYGSSKDSEGSALKENEAYLESIQGHLNQLKNTWDNLWVGENNREFINFFLDLAKGALEALDAVGGLKTALIGGGGLFAGIKMFQSGGRAKCCPSSKYATGEFSSDVCELCAA